MIVKIGTFNTSHDDVGGVVGFEVFVDVDEIGVLEPGDGAGFVEESFPGPGEGFLIGGRLCGDREIGKPDGEVCRKELFDGDTSFKFGIDGKIGDGKATRSEDVLDLIFSEEVSDGESEMVFF